MQADRTNELSALLAERLLIDIIGLDWEDVHAEACRWEHVMSEAVERRILEITGNPRYEAIVRRMAFPQPGS